MNDRRHILLFSILLTAFLGARAQSPGDGAQQQVSIRNFSVKENATDFMTKRPGIELEFDVHFTRYEEEFFDRSYKLFYRLENASGEVVYDSRTQESASLRYESIRPDRPWRDKTATYMEDTNEDIFIPYERLPLESGPQSLEVVFTLEGKHDFFEDFAREKVSFLHRKIVLHSFSEQEFSVENIRFEQHAKGFGVNDPGMKIIFDLGVKYGTGEIRSKGYNLAWKLRSPSGKVLYDCREASSIHHNGKHISANRLDKKRVNSVDMFIRYADLDMDGPGDVEVVIEASAEGEGRREIYAETHRVEVPVKYRFEDQEFTVGTIVADTGSNRGAGGICIRFDCGFKHYSTLMNPEIGDYYFYVVLRDKAGKVVYDPGTPVSAGYGSTVGATARMPTFEQHSMDVELFIPHFRLRIPEGRQELSWTLHVSDKLKKVKFPTLGTGNVRFTQPKTYTYDIYVSELRVVPNNYDTQVGPFGSQHPDLRWCLRVGGDEEYSSATIKNSLSARSGRKKLRFCAGDRIALVLYDIDNGIFNRNDYLGRWVFPYEAHDGDFDFVIEQQGMINRMEVSLKRIDR